MSQPETLAMPDGWQAARGHSQLVKGFVHRAFPSEGDYPVLDVLEIGRRDGERTRAVLAAAGSVDLVATR